MAKNKSGRSRTADKAQKQQVPETCAADDNITQPDNINVDDSQADASATESEVKLSFGEKIASIFAPIRQLKEAVAEAEIRAEADSSRISELEGQLNEITVRNTGLQENLNKAQSRATQAKNQLKELDAELGKVRAELDDTARKLSAARADSFAEVSKTFPAGIQGRFRSYIDMAEAVAAYEASASAKAPERSLAKILEDPTPLEKDALLRHALGLMIKDRLIPANSTNWRVAVDSLRRKEIETETLKGQLAAADKKLKEAGEADHEAGLICGFDTDSLSERVRAAIAPWLCRRINALIDNENRHIEDSGDLDAILAAVAAAAGRPADHDEAVADGVRSVLVPLSELTGHEICSPDNLAAELARYFDGRLRSEVMPRFTEAGEDERRSLDTLVSAANAALADRTKIDVLLKKLETDRIEQIYECAISHHFEDIIEKNRPDEAPEEVLKAFACDTSFDAIVRHLVKAVSTTDRLRAKACKEAEVASAEVAQLKQELADAARTRADMETAHREAMAELRKDTDDELLAQTQRHEAALAKQKEELEAAHAEITTALEAGISARDADIRSLFDAYLGSVKQSLQTVADDITAAYTGPRDDNAVADVIDHNIIDNDIYGFDEFRASLLARLDAAAPLTADAVRGAVRAAFTDILKIESATWIDNLARLALYSQVPFIAAGFTATGVHIECFAAALTALKAILAQGGITLQLPRLFVDRFDESLHNAEAIKNITSVVSDVASHVTDDETVIDLFTVGYSIDGAEVRKPTVSRLNC